MCKLLRKTATEICGWELEAPGRSHPSALLVRLRHPAGARMRSVRVNGREWTDFDASKEWVRIEHPGETKYAIAATY